MYFLDVNAHMPISNVAFEEMRAANYIGNPMSSSAFGRAASSRLEESRERIANVFGVNKNNIIITSTITQACEWGVDLFFKSRNNIFSTQIEHFAIKDAIKKRKYMIIPTLKTGVIDTSSIPDEASIICTKVQPEIGTIQPDVNRQTLSDMSQAVGKIPVKFKEYSIFGAHKFGGPNIGFLYIHDLDEWQEFGTGSRYFLDRPGTPDLVSVAGAAAALEDSMKTLDNRTRRCLEFKNELEPALKDMGFEIIGDGEERIPGTTFVECPISSVVLMHQLEKEGATVGLGSACGSLHTGPSPLMKVLGRKTDTNRYMRISQFGDYGRTDGSKVASIFKKSINALL